MRVSALALLLLCPMMLFSEKTCYSPEDALAHQNKDVCIAAHVYDVVELADGTRFLDVCSPDTPDEQCRFTVMSANGDRKTVGDLSTFRQQDIRIRGVVRPFGGRGEILLSDARQFHGGGGEVSAQSGAAAWVFGGGCPARGE
jgi:hypothetical protein